MLKFRWQTEFKGMEIGFEIPTDWDEKEIGEILAIKYGRGLPERNRRNGNYKVFGSSGVVGYHNQALAKGPGLIIGRKGNIGSIFLSKKDFFPIDTVFYVENAQNAVSLYYILRGIDFEQLMSDSAVPGLNINFLKGIKIPFPSSLELPRIGVVLSWFDELINNKTQQNEILEKTAMAIFKSWFINFEPFKKEDFVDSELGKIPRGWEITKLADMCEIIMGQSPPSRYYNENEEGLLFIQGKGQLGKYMPDTNIYCSKIIKLARPMDVLITVRAPIGEINIAEKEYIIGRGLAAIRSKYWSYILSYLLYNIELLKASERGTTFDAITKEELTNFPLIKPFSTVLEKFVNIVGSLYKKIILNQKQIIVLKKVRDTLLPLLVFGKLRVEEI